MILGWVISLGLLVTVGCGSHIRNVPEANIIMINAKGQPVDPTGNIRCQPELNGACNGRHTTLREYHPYNDFADYRSHIERVITGLRKYREEKSAACEFDYSGTQACKALRDNERNKRILIHIHGGLNRQVETVERAAELYQGILEDGAHPIFINWQSSLIPSYQYHLTDIRQGEDWNQGTWSSVGAYLTAPFYLAADLARAGVRLPTATFLQIRNDIETVPYLSWLHSADLVLAQETMFKELCRRRNDKDTDVADSLQEYVRILDKTHADCEKVEVTSQEDLTELKIWLGHDEREFAEKFLASIKYIITFPTKLLSAPVIDALGTSSWDVMLRSASQLFHYDSWQVSHTGLDISPADKTRFTQTGALSFFLEKLKEEICAKDEQTVHATNFQSTKCNNKEGWEITLIGHSMGAIVVNHIIRDFGDLPITNVVYMAAASSIQDYQDTIFPYLRSKNSAIPPSTKQCTNKSHAGVCVYHLMLHEAAESGEWSSDILDPFPRGSLLVWLDNFLTHPLSREDRRLGRFTNFIVAAHHTPQALRPYINIVKFGVGDGVLSPQKHGEFGGKLDFWKPQCWGKPADNPRNCYRSNGHY